jgi:hypothetical protein
MGRVGLVSELNDSVRDPAPPRRSDHRQREFVGAVPYFRQALYRYRA